MKKIFAVIMTLLIVLTGCSALTKDEPVPVTAHCEIFTPLFEDYTIDIEGTKESLDVIVIKAILQDDALQDLDEDEIKEQYEALEEEYADLPGITSEFEIKDDILSMTTTIVVEDLDELPDAFTLTRLESVEDLQKYGVDKLVDDFISSGANCDIEEIVIEAQD